MSNKFGWIKTGAMYNACRFTLMQNANRTCSNISHMLWEALTNRDEQQLENAIRELDLLKDEISEIRDFIKFPNE